MTENLIQPAPNASSSEADFGPLGDVELQSIADLFNAANLGRRVASNASLILGQFAYDVAASLATIPPMSGGNPRARAKTVSRHAVRAAWHLRAAQRSLAKLPHAFNKEFQAEIQHARRKSTKRFHLGGE